MALARDCKHPDAVWLASIFEGKDVSTTDGAREVFLLHRNDDRALCFPRWLTHDREYDLSLLRRASEMGNAFACSMLCWRENKEEAFRLAQFAASQRERDGSYWLGCCFRDCLGCEKDLNLAKENFLIAAELGNVWAAVAFGRLFDESAPARWMWLGRATLHGGHASFLECFSKQVRLFCSGSGNASAVFLIGLALKGKINMAKKEIFGECWPYDFHLLGPANQAVSFYDSQIHSARLAIDTWTLVSTRLHLIKDMRMFIGKMIWEARFEANYEFDLRDYGVSSPTNSSSASSSPAPSLKRSRKK